MRDVFLDLGRLRRPLVLVDELLDSDGALVIVTVKRIDFFFLRLDREAFE